MASEPGGPVPGAPVPGDTAAGPVFVLTAARSGSTLLRFILDSHPDLACPPETGLAAACAAVLHAWQVLEAPAATRAGRRPGHASRPALAAARGMADTAFAHYLAGTGKRRWCDKSLSTAWYAGLIAEIYPEARFICLYRHCTDMIASALEAWPWGIALGPNWATTLAPILNHFAARHPGDTVTAVTEYWLECSRRVAAFEHHYADRCYRLRYEDLVSEPEAVTASLFGFLGLTQVPGITRTCLRASHDTGPSDAKIWFTSDIVRGSVGRGTAVPARRIAPQVRAGMNEMLAALGYRPVDEHWDQLAGPADPRAEPPAAQTADGGQADGAAVAPGAGQRPELAAVLRGLQCRMSSRSAAELRRLREFCPAVARAEVLLVARDGDGARQEMYWSFAAAQAAADGELGPDEPPGAAGRIQVTFLASPATWQSLLAGSANMASELDAGRLGYRGYAEGDGIIGTRELKAVAALIGLIQVP